MFKSNNDAKPKSLTESSFDILKKHIYADPVEVMIESLAKHAAAEQAKIGVERPFLVNLPCINSPNFYVRDHGPGYTREQVDTVFSASSGDSVNGDANVDILVTSPLTYTPILAVSTYNEGTLSFYIVVFDIDTGKPKPKFINSQPAADIIPSGTHIQVSVEPKDFERFENAARKILVNYNADVRRDGVPVALGGVGGTAPSF